MVNRLLVLALCLTLVIPCGADAGLLYHATKGSLMKKIATKGFSKRMMSAESRFGKKIYMGATRKTALLEKPRADTLMGFKETALLRRNTLDLRKMSLNDIKFFSGDKNLRGNIKNRIIGPNLGRKIGRSAEIQKKAVIYRSAKDHSRTNLFLPFSLYKEHPKIIRLERLIGNVR